MKPLPVCNPSQLQLFPDAALEEPPSSEPYVVPPEDEDPCVRSPCDVYQDVWDPKANMEEIAAARLLVGTPKLRRGIVGTTEEPTGKVYTRGAKAGQPKTRTVPIFQDFPHHHRPGEPDWPFAVSYGIGIDSTAILVGLVQLYRETGDERFRPQIITFADTGAEKVTTYGYLELINHFLTRHGFPTVTTVGWSQSGDFGTHLTLEQKCLNNHTLPSISASGFKRSECSKTWKQDPQNAWFRDHSGIYELSYKHNCTSKALSYLVSLQASDEVRGVASAIQCSTGAARSALKRLEAGGLIYGTKHARKTYYYATDEGEEAHHNKRLMDSTPVLPEGLKIVKAIGYDATEIERLDANALGSTFRAGDDPDAHDYTYWYPLMEWGWDRARCYAEIEHEIGYVPPKSSCFFCGAMKPEEIAALSKEDLVRSVLMEQVHMRGRHKHKRGIAFQYTWTDFALGRVTKGMTSRARELIGGYVTPDGESIQGFGQLLSEEEVSEIQTLADLWISAFPGKAEGRRDYHEIGAEMGLLAFVDPRGLRAQDGLSWWGGRRFLRNPGLPYDPLLDGNLPG